LLQCFCCNILLQKQCCNNFVALLRNVAMSLQCHWDQAWTQQRLPKNIQKKDRAHQNCCDATLKHPVPITPWLLCQRSKCAIKGQSPILGLNLLNQFAHALCFHFCYTNFFFACQHLRPINLQRAKLRSANFCSTLRCCPSGLTNDICGTKCSALCPTPTNSHEEPCSQQNNRPSAVQWQHSSSLRNRCAACTFLWPANITLLDWRVTVVLSCAKCLVLRFAQI